MNGVPEILLGKSRREWTPLEHQAVCVGTGAAGGALWTGLLLVIQVLRPGLNLPWGGILTAGILYAAGLTWRAWCLLPPPKAKPARTPLKTREAPPPAKTGFHWREWISTTFKGWIWIFPALGALEMIWGGIYLAGFMRFDWGVAFIEVLWRSAGALLAIAGGMAFLRRRVSRWLQMAAWGTVTALSLLTLGVSIPYSPLNDPATARFIVKMLCLMSLSGGLLLFFTRPPAHRHYHGTSV